MPMQGSSSKEKDEGRMSILRCVSGVLLLFTLSNFIQEYMDVKGVQKSFNFDNIVQAMTNMSSSLDFTDLGITNNNNPQDTTTEATTSTSAPKTNNNQNPYRTNIVPLPELVRVDEQVDCTKLNQWLQPIPSVSDPVADLGIGRKIPKIVHMTGKHKCTTKDFVEAAHAWTFPNHSFYYHDDQAVHKILFEREWPEFPQMKNAWECLKNSGGAALADLWRYVLLWEYGGIYTDMDNLPGPLMNETTITPDIDAFFLQEGGGFISQFFFAVSPRHPMMFLAVHDVMEQMHQVDDTGKIYLPFSTGPGATKRAFLRFMGANSKSPDWFFKKYGYPDAGTYFGTFGHNRSVTVVGTRRTGADWLLRSALGRQKNKAWQMMNVTDYQAANKEKSGKTALMYLHDWHAEQRQKFENETLRRM